MTIDQSGALQPFWNHRGPEEVAAAAGIAPVIDPSELFIEGFWDSEEEMEAFIADTYAARCAPRQLSD